jgi:hypothetical protein
MILIFWLMIFGILLTFIGTLLLIFSLPASFKIEPGTREVYIGFHSGPLDLFHDRVVKNPDYSIISALIFLSIGVIFQITSIWLDIKPDYLSLVNRTLNILGIAISFIGTIFMLYGGMDTIIKVVRAKDGQYSFTAPVSAAEGNSDYEEARKKNIKEYEYIGRRLLINKIGIWLLFIGFMIQFLVELSDN